MFKKVSIVLILICLALLSAGSVSAANNTTTVSSANNPVSSTVTTTAKITTINKATGGNLNKNTLLMKYIKKTVLAKQIISKAKYGTPLVKFGNGKGPIVLIVAGVHGNELPAPAAAMKLINYLNGKSIRGTVYVVPFAIPYNTAYKLRYWHGKNPNSIANIYGSPTNIIVNLAVKLHVNAIGDFHSTKPGGDPGKKSFFCSILPTTKSYSIAWYISKKTGSHLLVYKKAGTDYPGAVEDTSNLRGIPAVTCEVISSHGTLNQNKINNSFNQMIALLKYFNII
jgi:uncharacterized protein